MTIKKLKFVFLTTVTVFCFSVFLNTVLADDSASCSAIGFQYCAVSDSCVNTESACRPTTTTSSSSGQTDGSYNNADGCTGNIRYDETAARECARRAEEQGRAKGYNISCTTESSPEVVSLNGTATGQNATSYQSLCTVNGQSGFGAVNLAGYKGQGEGYNTWDPFFGTTQIFGSGFNINSGWNTLNVELNRNNTSSSGSGSASGSSLIVPPANRASSANNSIAIQINETQRQINAIRSEILNLYNSLYTSELQNLKEAIPSLTNTVDRIITNTNNRADGTGTGQVGSSGSSSGSGSFGSSGSSAFGGGSASSCFVFRTNLALGDENVDVRKLVDVLITEGLLNSRDITLQPIMSFTRQVELAVKAYQEKYSSEILAPLSLTTPTGFVGVSTRAKLNSRCQSSTAGQGSTGSSSNNNVIQNVPPPNTDPNNLSFRFLKIYTEERGWVSWREVEVYDKSGQKINISQSSINAPSFVFNANTQSQNDSSKAVDGNIDTSWNAGETNLPCRLPGATGCPSAIRTATFLVDLGSAKQISKIKLTQNGDTVSETTTVSISNNNKDFFELTKFLAPMADKQVLVFPKSTTTTDRPAPSLSGKLVSKQIPNADNIAPGELEQISSKLKDEALKIKTSTENGEVKLKLTVNSMNYLPSSNFQYLWKIENADYVKIEKKIETDTSLGTLTETESGGACATVGSKYDEFVFPSSLYPWWGDYIFPSGFVRPNDSFVPMYDYVVLCNVGKRYITTLKAIQVDTDKTVEFKFILEVSR